jgi:hypothetical protein
MENQINLLLTLNNEWQSWLKHVRFGLIQDNIA